MRHIIAVLLLLFSQSILAWTPCAPFCDAGCSGAQINILGQNTSNSIQLFQQKIENVNLNLSKVNTSFVDFAINYTDTTLSNTDDLADVIMRSSLGIVSEFDNTLYSLANTGTLKASIISDTLKAINLKQSSLKVSREVSTPIYIFNFEDIETVRKNLSEDVLSNIVAFNPQLNQKKENIRALPRVLLSNNDISELTINAFKKNIELSELKSLGSWWASQLSKNALVDAEITFKLLYKFKAINSEDDVSLDTFIHDIISNGALSPEMAKNIQTGSKESLIKTLTIYKQLQLHQLKRLYLLKKEGNRLLAKSLIN